MLRQDSFSRFFQARSVLMSPHHFSDIHAKVSMQQMARRVWETPLPHALRSVTKPVRSHRAVVLPSDDSEALAKLFPRTWGQPLVDLMPDDFDELDFSRHTPLRVGVVLSGGQAAGGHNVISGIFDYVKQCNAQSQVIGFLNGPKGLFTHAYKTIDDATMDQYRNMGGFDMICSGRDKIETAEQKAKSMEVCQKLDLHGLVIIGGDDSNTNGAVLAEYFKEHGCRTAVVGAPKTVDGDLKNQYIEQSFGFDTATKVYSELIGNLCVDVATSQDRYHFVRLMGRSASNIALECALQTRANLTFIGEEVEAKKRSLMSLITEICDMIQRRYDEQQRSYGVILIPEGLIEFIPEVGALISEINEILADGEFDKAKLSANSLKVFEEFPEDIRHELLLERDSHGNVQVAKIATEKLLILMVQTELTRRDFKGPFCPNAHYFGYEGRCPMPSNFDAKYCYALGHAAGSLIDNGLTGYMAVMRHLDRAVEHWKPAGCPVTIMMNIERRKGQDVPVIKKYLVDLKGSLFRVFTEVREEWKYRDLYRSPGPIQFSGVCADIVTYSLKPPTNVDLLPEVPPSHCNFAKSEAAMSLLQRERLRFRPPVAPVLQDVAARASAAKKVPYQDVQQERYIRRAYPLTCDLHSMRAYAVEPSGSHPPAVSDLEGPVVGVVQIGQAVPGVTNVVCGLYERLQLVGGRLVGFKGIRGLLENDCIRIEREHVDLYINSGGCELLGRTPSVRSLLRTDEGINKAARTCRALNLSGLVIIGGKFSLTDGALLSEFFLAQNLRTRVVCVPANQENNVRHPLLEMAIGFDSASKAYAALVGNMETDAASARKYWYFVRVMGNVTSHSVLEVALQTHPNVVVISEKYVEENLQMHELVRDMANTIVTRAEKGENYGVAIIPEGLLTSLPQMRALLGEIDDVWAAQDPEQRRAFTEKLLKNEDCEELSPWCLSLAKSLPMFFKEQLIKETPSGRLEVSELAIEQLLAVWVKRELEDRKKAGRFKGSFNPVCTYLGFQCRSTMPSNFDCSLGLAHGFLAGILIESGLTGMLTSVRGLCGRPQSWRMSAIPLQALMRVMPDAEEKMYGRRVPIIPGSDVDLDGSAYAALCEGMEQWETPDHYLNPGPIQFSGKTAHHYNRTLFEEQFEYMVMLEELEALTGYVGGVCSFGVSRETLKTSVVSLQALADILTGMSKKRTSLATLSGSSASWDAYTS
eukprot:Blabericola_migrator_1__5489@NODE_27_length_20109_cov_273_259006_g24_i0_p2_GENE_NODE_27_length_20109_cov_273_259006_g24_i0NODE_27_length_20109_cov_273_259006_g24_i0_p2_ORF_typecomplete_len1209_score226_82PFK/PF00365_20/5_4e78PFK/PF00365_20/6_4e55LYTB/PF02401_18/0_11UBM/PF14377_6/0_4Sulfatase/PF00884_23/1_2_NODE_27_length_20109_cov_273_259006_g24_i08124438